MIWDYVYLSVYSRSCISFFICFLLFSSFSLSFLVFFCLYSVVFFLFFLFFLFPSYVRCSCYSFQTDTVLFLWKWNICNKTKSFDRTTHKEIYIHANWDNKVKFIYYYLYAYIFCSSWFINAFHVNKYAWVLSVVQLFTNTMFQYG